MPRTLHAGEHIPVTIGPKGHAQCILCAEWDTDPAWAHGCPDKRSTPKESE